MTEARRFAAFISYSHRDERWAAWLQRSIERYRVPKRLVGKNGDHGPVPARPGQVFRDRDELAASAELSDSVGQGLEASEFLLVVCSPRAAASRWVGEEILRFKQLHGEGRILCLVVDGDPAAVDENACFPRPLRYALAEDGSLSDTRVEPLAADVRPGGDGKTLARQKILAGLLGLPLDALRQREQQRRQRVLAGVTAASVAGMAFTGWLAWTAMLARADAERRQGQAEDLVEFILSDLQEGLRKVGRLDIMQSAALEARSYFSRLDVRDLTVEALQGHAESLRQLGDLLLRQGQSAEAYAAFEEAYRMDAELLARDPQDQQRVFNLGQDEFWLGYALLEGGDPNAALVHFERYMEFSRTLYATDSSNVDWVMELCYAYNNLASVQADEGQTAIAIEHMRKALDYNIEAVALAPDDPALLAELAYSEGWLATILRESGQLTESLETRVISRDRWQALHDADPSDASTRFELALALRTEGYTNSALGQVAAAQMSLDLSRSHLGTLVTLDPSNTLWALEYLGALIDRLLVSADGEGIEGKLLQALDAQAWPMAESPPESPLYRARLATSLAFGTWVNPEDRRGLDRALVLINSALEDEPDNAGMIAMSAQIANLAWKLDHEAAAGHVDEVLQWAQSRDQAPVDPYELAAIIELQLLSRPESVDATWLSQLWSTGYRHPAFMAQCQAVEGCRFPD